jgi:hypothetical protein
MMDVSQSCAKSDDIEDIMTAVRSQQETLRKEVSKYCTERGVAS